jgi:hypothetical protein
MAGTKRAGLIGRLSPESYRKSETGCADTRTNVGEMSR